MRLRFRLTISLIIGITIVSLLFTWSAVRTEKRNLRTDLQRRAEILAESLGAAVTPFFNLNEPADRTVHPTNSREVLSKRSRTEVQRLVDRFGNRERLAGIAVYGSHDEPVAMTAGLAAHLGAVEKMVSVATTQDKSSSSFLRIADQPMHVYVLPLDRDGTILGALAIFHDTAYIETQSSRIWVTTLKSVALETLLIILVTLLIVRWSISGPIARMAQWVRETRAGKYLPAPDLSDEEMFKTLTREVRHMATSLAAARAAAEEEARLRDAVESTWTPERLRVHIRSRLGESRLFAVSNREPYSHVRAGDQSTEVLVPASGLVTALEPILEACNGTWIAHGSGNADRETVDEHDHLRVPPDHPVYTLRRVWLTPQEEEGYYFGFANEGLWPLCHIAYARPIFRVGDWNYYQEVNRKFAKVLLQEIEGVEHPMVLAQDYHFALLPRLIKQERPDARLAIFWHIPWPNPQAFGICPWQRELLDGLLGADLIGFHIQAHCNHFLETVDGALESVVDMEHFAISRLGHRTAVRPFPISVAFPDTELTSTNGSRPSLYLERAEIFRQLGVESAFMGIGVDRMDYTKGIPERLRGVERFLEKHPSYCGQFTFVQIGAPSRSQIPRYHDLSVEVQAEVERINDRFQTNKWRPIVLLQRHHSHSEIAKFYKAADICMVTSLHDGMNLVAKEFVASRDDEQGTLILSRFTGASRQLPDAVLVNPYDTEQLAEAIRFALEMPPEEKRARMRRMRAAVKEHNVYRWAANLITDLSEIRLDAREMAREVE